MTPDQLKQKLLAKCFVNENARAIKMHLDIFESLIDIIVEQRQALEHVAGITECETCKFIRDADDFLNHDMETSCAAVLATDEALKKMGVE